jgi:hypothetical protein
VFAWEALPSLHCAPHHVTKTSLGPVRSLLEPQAKSSNVRQNHLCSCSPPFSGRRPTPNLMISDPSLLARLFVGFKARWSQM